MESGDWFYVDVFGGHRENVFTFNLVHKEIV
jgi:hypothetical protein